jgi:hypothetical protein
MAKYPHHPDTLIVLRDIENRLTQLMEANEMARPTHPDLVEWQNRALASAKQLVQQAIDTGHVFRGSWAVPDGMLPYFQTPPPEQTLNKSSNDNK